MRKFSTPLSSYLPEMIRQGAHDMLSIDTEQYSLSALKWHEPAYGMWGSKCGVCLAGAVMAKRCSDGDSNTLLHPVQFDDDLANKLYVLNAVRAGTIARITYYITDHCMSVRPTLKQMGDMAYEIKRAHKRTIRHKGFKTQEKGIKFAKSLLEFADEIEHIIQRYSVVK